MGSDQTFSHCLSHILVERAFSAVIALLDSKRNCFEIVNRGDLRLFLTKLKPGIDELITKHQPYLSH